VPWGGPGARGGWVGCGRALAAGALFTRVRWPATGAGARGSAPSETTREKVNDPPAGGTSGATNVGLAAVASLSVIPAGAVHANVSASPSGSADAEPSSVTVDPSVTVWLAPALAPPGRVTLCTA